MWAKMNLQRNFECQRIFRQYGHTKFKIDDGQMCTKGVQVGDKYTGTCTGDR